MTLSTLLSESAREFDERVAEKRGILAREGHVLIPILFEEEEVRTFLLSKQRAVIEAVIVEVEGMKDNAYFECHCLCCGNCEHPKETEKDKALTDLQSRLREALSETRV